MGGRLATPCDPNAYRTLHGAGKRARQRVAAQRASAHDSEAQVSERRRWCNESCMEQRSDLQCSGPGGEVVTRRGVRGRGAACGAMWVCVVAEQRCAWVQRGQCYDSGTTAGKRCRRGHTSISTVCAAGKALATEFSAWHAGTREFHECLGMPSHTHPCSGTDGGQISRRIGRRGRRVSQLRCPTRYRHWQRAPPHACALTCGPERGHVTSLPPDI